ncbi:MAG: hypothetical protein HOP29_07160 [Phycisphaerales bacterium]|nr:hypothetical protein [Phycisphaerales bacterium]
MDLLGVRNLPYLARRNYYYEFLHLIPWGLLTGVVEGNLSAIVVAKTFRGGDLLVATASATPVGALFLSMAFGMISVGRPKLRLSMLYCAGTAICVMSVALVPRTEWGGILFVIQMALAQVFLCGVVTLRGALWKRNYPVRARGLITARLQALRMLAGVVTLLLLPALFDLDPNWYRATYAATGLAGVVAVILLRKMRVRHEKSELAGAGRTTEDEALERMGLWEALWPISVLARAWRILRGDAAFTRYLVAQMLLGIGVHMVVPVMVITLDETFAYYWISAVLVEVIPQVATFGSLRRWGPFFDRVPLPRFRVYTSLAAAVGMIFGMVATIAVTGEGGVREAIAFPLAALLFALRGVAHGVQRGGASLAWNLGHLHFSSGGDAELYLGVHMSLTGIRAIVGPFLGVGLAQAMGWGVWGVGCGLCLLSAREFHQMARQESDGQMR